MLGGKYNPLTASSWDPYDAISGRLRAERRAGSPEATFEYRLISMAAYPGDFRDLVARLQAGDATAVEPALLWLDSDVFCMHSGYAKERVMRYLSRSVLSTRQAARVAALLLRVITRGGRPEFRMACRLAAKVQTAEFRSALKDLRISGDAGTVQRAEWMLRACERARTVT